jgi:hypothetical protein
MNAAMRKPASLNTGIGSVEARMNAPSFGFTGGFVRRQDLT